MPPCPFTIYISGNEVKGKDWIKERSWDFRCKQTFIALGSSDVHFPHRIICNTEALYEIVVCCVSRVSLLSFKQITTKYRFQILVEIICSSFFSFPPPSISDLSKELGCYFLTVENANLSILGIQIGNPITTGETVHRTYPKVSQAICYRLYVSDTKLYFCVFATTFKHLKKQKATSSTSFLIVNHNQHWTVNSTLSNLYYKILVHCTNQCESYSTTQN